MLENLTLSFKHQETSLKYFQDALNLANKFINGCCIPNITLELKKLILVPIEQAVELKCFKYESITK